MGAEARFADWGKEERSSEALVSLSEREGRILRSSTQLGLQHHPSYCEYPDRRIGCFRAELSAGAPHVLGQSGRQVRQAGCSWAAWQPWGEAFLVPCPCHGTRIGGLSMEVPGLTQIPRNSCSPALPQEGFALLERRLCTECSAQPRGVGEGERCFGLLSSE